MVQRLISLGVVVALSAACEEWATDCHITKTCPSDPNACGGVCVPVGTESYGWSRDPFLLRQVRGPLTTPLMCPGNAGQPGFVGYSNPDQSSQCPDCSCDPPSGFCSLPPSMTASHAMCSDTGTSVPFDPPSGWDGGCTPYNAVVSPSTQSVTVAPLVVNDDACMPIELPKTKLVTWGTVAYACEGVAVGSCANSSEICAPLPPDGFTVCVNQKGDIDTTVVHCPSGYPKPYVFYLDADDQRSCSPCTCDPPQESTCSSLVTVYAESACSAEVGAITATSSAPMCLNVPLGSPLGSKTATPPAYSPGSCHPNGGAQFGSIHPKDPYTFCCQQ
jgi:hypothetical protein